MDGQPVPGQPSDRSKKTSQRTLPKGKHSAPYFDRFGVFTAKIGILSVVDKIVLFLRSSTDPDGKISQY
jgi:hypothetical protein